MACIQFAALTVSADWSHATWSLGSAVNDRLPCSVSLLGQAAHGAVAFTLAPGRGFGDVSIPAQLTLAFNAQLTASATIAFLIGVNLEGPAATGIDWTVAGVATMERIGPHP